MRPEQRCSGKRMLACLYSQAGNSFNEAGAAMLRKTLRMDEDGESIISASMRPEQRCSGKQPSEQESHLRFSSFNEAGAAMLRKTRIRVTLNGSSSSRFNEAGAAMLRKTSGRAL